MSLSPLALAALSTLAVPGVDIQLVQSLPVVQGFDAAVVIDAEQRRWVVRAPNTLAAGAALEAECAFLSELEVLVHDGRLPFEVPRAVGFAPLAQGGRAVVYAELPGHPLRVERVRPGPGLAASLGRALAALHELPVELVERAGLPVYSADEYRQRRLTEVDEAAATGKVPTVLLRRWEKQLEDVSLWRFRPTVTHSAITADTLLVRAGQLSAITDFFDTQVADPADDLAWLMVSAPADSLDSIMEAYRLRRGELLDKHVVDRALLASELALARWLLHGVRSGLDDVVADALSMLADLERAATEVGAFAAAAQASASLVNEQRAQQAAAQAQALDKVLTPPLPPPPTPEEAELLLQEGLNIPKYDKPAVSGVTEVDTAAYTTARWSSPATPQPTPSTTQQ